MTYDAEIERVTYRSDKPDGPTAGPATGDPLEFLARLVTHIPDPGQVMQRYYGWYASRTRGTRRRRGREPPGTEAAVAIVEPADWSLRAARFRWVERLRRIFEVDPLRCPQCRGPMRIVAVITDPAVIGPILTRSPRPLARGPLACPGVPGVAALGPATAGVRTDGDPHPAPREVARAPGDRRGAPSRQRAPGLVG